MTEDMHDSSLVVGGGCQWLSVYEHSLLTGSLRRPEAATVACCNCKIRLDYVQAWVVVPFGVHRNRLPLPAFIFCEACSLILDPRQAWMAAYQRDKNASLPDPDKVKREAELNRKLNPFMNPDLLP